MARSRFASSMGEKFPVRIRARLFVAFNRKIHDFLVRSRHGTFTEGNRSPRKDRRMRNLRQKNVDQTVLRPPRRIVLALLLQALADLRGTKNSPCRKKPQWRSASGYSASCDLQIFREAKRHVRSLRSRANSSRQYRPLPRNKKAVWLALQ